MSCSRSKLACRGLQDVPTFSHQAAAHLNPTARRPPAQPTSMPEAVVINRSPVMIIWAAAVAHAALGMDWSEALSVASAAAALFARAKGRSLGLYSDGPSAAAQTHESARIMGQAVPIQRTEHGSRGLALPYGASSADVPLAPVAPTTVLRSLENAFGEHLGAVWHVMLDLATAVPSERLRADGGRLAYDLYAE